MQEFFGKENYAQKLYDEMGSLLNHGPQNTRTGAIFSAFMAEITRGIEAGVVKQYPTDFDPAWLTIPLPEDIAFASEEKKRALIYGLKPIVQSSSFAASVTEERRAAAGQGVGPTL